MDTAFVTTKTITSDVTLDDLLVLVATYNVELDAKFSVLFVVVFEQLIN